ncbi:hypothetical protein ACIBLB_14650 [Streptosporangium canum]|uniref:hypothetical protein n=1 Tax=Streptosporangium canum TaxID=324952 RepID=UPI00378B719D
MLPCVGEPYGSPAPVPSTTWPGEARSKAVPRKRFLGSAVARVTEDGEWEVIHRAEVTEDEWLHLVYRDETWVTQIDGSMVEGAHGTVSGAPTSSLTLPGLVVLMLGAAGISDVDKVLEVGTGTGYSAALMCHMLGSHAVTSVEYNPAVAGRARDALTAAGYAPTLVTGVARGSRVDPEVLDDPAGLFAAQLAAPSAVRLGGGDEAVLWDVATGSLAVTGLDPQGGWTVRQRGPLRLWDAVEAAVLTWQAAGSPHQSAYGLTVTREGQYVWLGDPNGPSWDLPI